MLNQIVLMGRLTLDPERRLTDSGIAVVHFTLAVERNFGQRESGEKETDFIDVIAWRNTAEFVCKYFTKGRMAVVSGRLQIRNWTDSDGAKRRIAEVIAESVYFGDSKPGGQAAGAVPAAQGSVAPDSAPVSDFAVLEDDDGELPF